MKSNDGKTWTHKLTTNHNFQTSFYFLAQWSQNQMHRIVGCHWKQRIHLCCSEIDLINVSIERMWHNHWIQMCLVAALGRSLCQLILFCFVFLPLSLSQNDCHFTFTCSSLSVLLIGLGSGLCPLPTFSWFNFLLGHDYIWSVLPPSDTALAEHYHHASCPCQYRTYSKDDKTYSHKEEVILVSQSWMALSSQPKAQIWETLAL